MKSHLLVGDLTAVLYQLYMISATYSVICTVIPCISARLRIHEKQERRYYSCLIDPSCEKQGQKRVPRLRVELPGFPILGDGNWDLKAFSMAWKSRETWRFMCGMIALQGPSTPNH